MDFRTKIDSQVYGVRATALLIKDGRIFLTKDKQHRYYAIGGAIEIGEKTADAAIRESMEELGIAVSVKELAFIVENQFIDRDISGQSLYWHNIEFHYIVESLEETPTQMIEGSYQQECEWIDIDKLVNLDVVPAFLKTELPRWSGQMKHIINMNEENE